MFSGMKKYRIREGSFMDYARFVPIGLALGPGLLLFYQYFCI